MPAEGSTDNQTQAPERAFTDTHAESKHRGTRREDSPEIQSRRGERTDTHTQKTPRNIGTRTRRSTQPQARTLRGTHTHSGWGRVQRSPGGESAPRELAAPPRRPAPRAPARICRGRLSQHVSEQGPAGRRRARVTVRPPAGSLCCAHAGGGGRGPRPGSRSRGVAPARVGEDPALSPPVVPALPAPEPSTEHPQVLSSLLIRLHGKLSPSRSWRRAVWPSPGLGGGSGGPYLRPRGFAEPQPPAGVAPRSGQRSSAGAAAAAAAPSPPLPGKPPPPPSRGPTNIVHMAPLSQWETSPSRSPCRVPSPFPG